jgi:NAD+ kinase
VNTKFKTIGLIGKYADPGIAGTLKKLSNYLKDRQLQVWVDQATADTLPNLGLPTASREKIGKTCDMVIVIGGDGTLLNTARALAESGRPLVGINLGRLGFLTDISPETMLERMEEILRGEYVAEERFLIHATIQRNGQIVNQCDAFNEVVIHKWNTASMIELETHINGQFVDVQRSDGMIVATPTGSTAYALSGGGPILHPALNAVVLVPVCPHTLSNRPIVVNGDSIIDIEVRDSKFNHAQLTSDGQNNFSLVNGDKIQIRKKEKPICLLHPKGHDHFQILREKLRWGSRASVEKA